MRGGEGLGCLKLAQRLSVGLGFHWKIQFHTSTEELFPLNLFENITSENRLEAVVVLLETKT